MNETKFCNSCKQSHMIITLHKVKKLQLHDSDNRIYITSAECISGSDLVISLLIIFSNVQISHFWGLKNDLNDNTTFTVSDTEYSNNVLALKWHVHLDFHSRKSQVNA